MRFRSPYNPLDDFQSYSTHFVLLACRTTVTAKKLASSNPNDMAASLEAINNTKFLGAPVVLDGKSQDIFLVLDTRRFSQFSIEDVKYDVLINGVAAGGSTSNLATDLTMTVTDSAGISFANFMQWLMDSQMKTNFDGIIFMLRTVFVGHNADGSSETVQTETIPLLLTRMNIDLSFARGMYNLEFMPNMNFDVNRHARFLTVSTATTYHSKDNSLGSMIASFQKSLNDESNRYYKDVQEQIGSGSSEQFGRKVNYMITIPEGWGTWKINGASPGGATEKLQTRLDVFETAKKKAADADKSKEQLEAEAKAKKDAAAKAEAQAKGGPGQLNDSYTSVSAGIIIPKALDAIFSQVSQIAEMGNFKSGVVIDGMITFYKHFVGITSGDDGMMVHVDVVEFKVPNLFAQGQRDKKVQPVSQNDTEFYVTDPQTGRQRPKDLLEWDFIFTGLNKDILSLDIKIEDFQFLLAQNLKIGADSLQALDADKRPAKEPIKDRTGIDDLLYARKYDPLILPLDTKAALSNYSKNKSNSLTKSSAESSADIAKQQQYSKNLSMFYAAAPIVIVMTIKGNPLIMHKFNVNEVLDHEKSKPNADGDGPIDTAAYRADLEARILRAGPFTKTENGFVRKDLALSTQSYTTAPVFARVNIMGPNVDPLTNTELPGKFTSSVLTDNYYVIFRVSNIFTKGVFTQELELYVHNVFGRSKKNDDARPNRGGQ